MAWWHWAPSCMTCSQTTLASILGHDDRRKSFLVTRAPSRIFYKCFLSLLMQYDFIFWVPANMDLIDAKLPVMWEHMSFSQRSVCKPTVWQFIRRIYRRLVHSIHCMRALYIGCMNATFSVHTLYLNMTRQNRISFYHLESEKQWNGPL